MSPNEMRGRAARYRSIATKIIDARTIDALHDLADEYEAQAGKIEAQGQVGDDGGSKVAPPDLSPGC
jgi:hypothetical protein